MPVRYTGKRDGVFFVRQRRHAYIKPVEKVGPRGGVYFLRGRDKHRVYHKEVKHRSLGHTGNYNKYGRKIYLGKLGGRHVVVGRKHVRAKPNMSIKFMFKKA